MSDGDGKPFYVLSLDGGGVKGIFSARILDLIHQKLDIDVYNRFDLIVGTSTGSIIAAALAKNYKLSELIEQYKELAPEVFRKSGLHKLTKYGYLWKSRYSLKPLERFLIEAFGETRLGEIDKPLILNATNVSLGGAYVFKSKYQQSKRQGDYHRDGETPLHKAVLASCAAPTYFDPVDISGTLVCDGGIWANNPALVGHIEAIDNFQKNHSNIRIMSIGAGKSSNFYQPNKKWGFFNGWRKDKLVDFVMDCQVQFPENYLSLLYKCTSKNFHRINPCIDSWNLDDFKIIPILDTMAANEFAGSSESIKRFLTGD